MQCIIAIAMAQALRQQRCHMQHVPDIPYQLE
jgi:hypothetical protein